MKRILLTILFLMACSTAYATTSPIAWWTFNEIDGYLWEDVVGGLNVNLFPETELITATLITPGMVGNASTTGQTLFFVDSSQSIVGSSGMTVSFWGLNLGYGDDGGGFFWLRNSNGGNLSGHGWAVLIGYDDYLVSSGIGFDVNSLDYGASGDSTWSAWHDVSSLSGWHFYTLTFDSNATTQAYIYIDGNDVTDARLVSDVNFGSLDSTAELKLTIGLNGGIDDLKIYDRALSIGEITYIVDPNICPVRILFTSDANGTVTTPGEGYQDVNCNSTSPLLATANPGYVFVNWTGDLALYITDQNSADTNLVLPSIDTMRADLREGNDWDGDRYGDFALMASFTATAVDNNFILTMTSTTGGEVNLPADGNSQYEPGTVVTIFAVADTCYDFNGWIIDGVASANDANCTLTMDANRTAEATFKIKVFHLTTSSGVGGSITVPGEDVCDYNCGDVVTITAVADANYYFVAYTGTAVDAGKVTDPNSATTTVTMDADANDTEVTATFAIYQRSLTITAGTGGTITTPSGSNPHWYDHGDVVTIVADINTGQRFVNWTMGEAKTVTGDVDFVDTAALGNYNVLGTYGGKTSYKNDSSAYCILWNGNKWNIYYNSTPLIVWGWSRFDTNIEGEYTPSVFNTGIATVTSVTGKIADPNSSSTTIIMDANYVVTANFEERPNYNRLECFFCTEK